MQCAGEHGDGVFLDPNADAKFFQLLRHGLRPVAFLDAQAASAGEVRPVLRRRDGE